MLDPNLGSCALSQQDRAIMSQRLTVLAADARSNIPIRQDTHRITHNAKGRSHYRGESVSVDHHARIRARILKPILQQSRLSSNEKNCSRGSFRAFPNQVYLGRARRVPRYPTRTHKKLIMVAGLDKIFFGMTLEARAFLCEEEGKERQTGRETVFFSMFRCFTFSGPLCNYSIVNSVC